ncbi:MAG: hypothetical protein JSW27_04395 [Phycisphaerales bacterium]|nr:MAG: hypothetical protein JSW27_04395 [Phycisphaerales bacterium]
MFLEVYPNDDIGGREAQANWEQGGQQKLTRGGKISLTGGTWVINMNN